MWFALVVLLAFPGKISGDGIESESYYSDENVQEMTTRRPAAAIVVVQGTARPRSSSPTPTSTRTSTGTNIADLSSPPTLIPATKDEEDDLLHFFDKKGKFYRFFLKKIPYRAVPYRTGPVKNAVP